MNRNKTVIRAGASPGRPLGRSTTALAFLAAAVFASCTRDSSNQSGNTSAAAQNANAAQRSAPPPSANAASPAAPFPPATPLQTPPSEDPGELPASITATRTPDGPWQVKFSYRPEHAVQSVHLAGSFNGWNPQGKPMEDPDGDGVLTAELKLGDGDYQYKFVLDGGRWIHDPQNPDRQPDGYSGFNSVFYLGRLATMKESPGKLGDGKIEPLGLLHKPQQPRYFQPLALDRVLLRYRTFAHDVERVSVALKGGGLTQMYVESEGPLFAYWQAELTLPAQPAAAGASRQIEYTFVLEGGATRVSDPQTYVVRFGPDDVFRTPDWARHAVWYQIMLDRFRNGDPGNDPDPVRPWTSDWFTPSPWETADGQTFYKWFVFRRLYGGDIAGLEAKLPYLKGLGVNAIYLNPIFQAESHHKYDATNYLHVDEHFGTKGDYEPVAATEDLLDPSTWKWTESDRRFLAFLKKAHADGFRVILDGVFNHVGTLHPAFQDVKKNGEQSRFADWFDVISWQPFDYRGWAGFKGLPVFRKSETGLASKSARQHIFNVTRRWMDPDGDGDPRDGVDGWRLDVPNEIPAPFWVEWRQLVKSINPDAYIVGEIWDRADQWLDGRHFDAVMNYRFAEAAVSWICHREKKLKPSEIDQRLAELRLAYPAAATYVMQNLLGSHDTDRLVSMALNPDRKYDSENRAQDNARYRNEKPGPAEYARARLVVLLQMTYVGAPMVYYGDEAGMWGADDPTNRKPMLWEDLQPYEKPEENFVMKDHLEFYRQAIALRNAHPALRSGAFRTLLADDAADVWAFERFTSDQRVIVVLNASDSPRDVQVPLPTGTASTWQRVFGLSGTTEAESGKLAVTVPAIGAVVLRNP